MTDHAPYVAAAYAVAAVILLAMIGWVAAGHRGAARRLAELERTGAVRRADRDA